MRRSFRTWLSVFTLMAFLLAACAPAATPVPQATQPPAQQATNPPAPTATSAPTTGGGLVNAEGNVKLPEVDPADYSGDIITMGSSTVFPLTERMAERFEAEGFAGRITIDSIGSGAGYERFCVAGESDIANASRPIRDSEVESCRAIGREPIEFRVGTDALAVVVSAENDFVTNLTMEQLALAFSTAASWSEVDPSFPNQPILRFIPGTDSGTYDYFVEEVFDNNQEPILNAANLQLSEDDNILVQGVLGSPYAIGFFGYAYFAENAGRLKTVAIDGIEPTDETAESGEYPLARPLFIYSDASILQAKPQVAAFINFYLTFVNEEVIDVGYFPASDQALNGARQAWLDAMQ
jgi:phosphate transport system substrate-binding protein